MIEPLVFDYNSYHNSWHFLFVKIGIFLHIVSRRKGNIWGLYFLFYQNVKLTWSQFCAAY